MEQNEIKAIISLLDDPDDAIYSQIKSKLIDIGSEAIPILEEAWDGCTYGPVFQNRVENIIHNIQFEKIKNELKAWKSVGQNNLLEGVLILSGYQYPELNREPVYKVLKTIEKDIWLELNDNLTALEKVKVMNHIIFDVHGFSGNNTNYHSAQNSYFNAVIESKKGNPISLAIIYIVVAERLGLPIFGVNLPRHFILAYNDPVPSIQSKDNVLFYINPFSKGTVLSRREVQHFLKQLKQEEDPRFFNPCSNLDIMVRIINNLIYSYELDKSSEKVEELKELSEMLSKE